MNECFLRQLSACGGVRWSAVMTVVGVKFALVDGKGVFNPAGGYVWIALYAAAAGIALTA